MVVVEEVKCLSQVKRIFCKNCGLVLRRGRFYRLLKTRRKYRQRPDVAGRIGGDNFSYFGLVGNTRAARIDRFAHVI